MGLRYFLPRRRENFINVVAVFVFFMVIIFVYSLLDDTSPSRAHPHKHLTNDKDVEVVDNEVGRRSMRHVIPDYSKPRQGPGENGQGVYLQGEERELGEKQMKTWFMNVVASDKIDMDRSIPDSRSADCKALKYDKDLPKASVVIIFTNEAWTPLMRTVHSVINRSPPEYLHEVVLIDDNSDHEWLKDQLTEYIKRFGGLVKLFRKTVRHGLIRAKIAGAEAATGEVVVFLDSHCEANAGWLEPILQRIKDKRTAVVCPVIDMISDSSMAYMGGSAGGIGTFWWSLHFKMDVIPEKELKRRKNPEVDPLMSPTMAGGLLAANREYFFEVGAYDPGMDIWGGENLEISFRVWMCGGSIEFLPCSHVGHIFRSGHPYNMTGPRGEDVHGMNSRRLAEVWMDDYKRFYYVQRMGLKDAEVGDLTERKELRKRLKCHDFKWYLDNMFSLSMQDELRRETTCTDAVQLNAAKTKAAVVVAECSEKNLRVWEHKRDGQLKHISSGLCLDLEGINSGDDIMLATCVDNKESQMWSFGRYY
uniref:Polypeptide N-acetylgalactosaminyltransferase n=1 Tax=Plectus sambesii TaxID=2011161 RepID=A0A914XRQ0_9BILA